jgi:hypothetical protein
VNLTHYISLFRISVFLSIVLFAYVALLSTACSSIQPASKSLAPLPNVLEREKVADIKLREGDPSYIEEYQVAIGMALAQMTRDEKEICDGLLAAKVLPHSDRMNMFLLQMTITERNYFSQKIAEMSESEKDLSLIRFRNMHSLERESYAHGLSAVLTEWRRLEQAIRRMKVKCSGKCG